MSVTLAPPMEFQFSIGGVPAVNYQLFTYVSGTSTKQATWTDYTQGTPNANPLRLDANGCASVWIDPTLTYKFLLTVPGDTDPPSTSVYTQNGISTGVTYVDGSVIHYDITPAESLAGVTPTEFYINTAPIDPRRYGAVGDGVTDDSAAIIKALSVGGNIWFPYDATYNVTQNFSMLQNQVVDLNGSTLKGTGANNIFSLANSYVRIMNGTIDVSGTTGRAIYAAAAIQQFIFQNLNIVGGTGTCIELVNAYSGSLRDVEMQAGSGRAIYIRSTINGTPVNSIWITNPSILGFTGSADLLTIEGGAGIFIEGLNSENNNYPGISATLTASSASIAATNTFTAGMIVQFSGNFASVTGLSANTFYYVISTGLSGSAFEVSATSGGSAITPGGSSTATVTVIACSNDVRITSNANAGCDNVIVSNAYFEDGANQSGSSIYIGDPATGTSGFVNCGVYDSYWQTSKQPINVGLYVNDDFEVRHPTFVSATGSPSPPILVNSSTANPRVINPSGSANAALASGRFSFGGNNLQPAGGMLFYGVGNPNSTVTASPGMLYQDNTSTAGVIWIKATGTGNTGWQPLQYNARAINQQTSTYQFVLSDMTKVVNHNSVSAHTWTIPASGTTLFPPECELQIQVNYGSGVITLAAAGGVTLYLGGSSTTGSRTLTGACIATLKNVATDIWVVYGPGVT